LHLPSTLKALDPSRFKELVEGGIPPNSLDKVAELTGLDSASLREELSKFARLHETLCNTLQDEFTTIPRDSDSHLNPTLNKALAQACTDGEKSAQET